MWMSQVQRTARARSRSQIQRPRAASSSAAARVRSRSPLPFRREPDGAQDAVSASGGRMAQGPWDIVATTSFLAKSVAKKIVDQHGVPEHDEAREHWIAEQSNVFENALRQRLTFSMKAADSADGRAPAPMPPWRLQRAPIPPWRFTELHALPDSSQRTSDGDAARRTSDGRSHDTSDGRSRRTSDGSGTRRTSDGRSHHTSAGRSQRASDGDDAARHNYGLRICVVGDSGLQLNRSKGTTSFERELKDLLGQNAEVVRFAVEGADTIASFLLAKDSLDVVVAVWLLNELFDKRNILLTEYPSSLDAAALRLACELKRFPHHLAVVGGSAALWEVAGQFDTWAERVRSIFIGEGILTVDGVDCYADLTMMKDGWHACSTSENKTRMASFYANLVSSLVAHGQKSSIASDGRSHHTSDGRPRRTSAESGTRRTSDGAQEAVSASGGRSDGAQEAVSLQIAPASSSVADASSSVVLAIAAPPTTGVVWQVPDGKGDMMTFSEPRLQRRLQDVNTGPQCLTGSAAAIHNKFANILEPMGAVTGAYAGYRNKDAPFYLALNASLGRSSSRVDKVVALDPTSIPGWWKPYPGWSGDKFSGIHIMRLRELELFLLNAKGRMIDSKGDKCTKTFPYKEAKHGRVPGEEAVGCYFSLMLAKTAYYIETKVDMDDWCVAVELEYKQRDCWPDGPICSWPHVQMRHPWCAPSEYLYCSMLYLVHRVPK